MKDDPNSTESSTQDRAVGLENGGPRQTWQSSLFAYDRLKALAFETETDFAKALELLFSNRSLAGMPADLVGNRTMIIPAAATEYFGGLRFEVQSVISSSDVPSDELAGLRKQQGHH